jgi:5-(carboxyamino)imidazole ribonucleotide synthase
LKVIPAGSTIGILGGGQLGKMIAQAASALGYNTHIYCPEGDTPAVEVATEVTHAAYDDIEALQKFGEVVDVVTLEFENIPYEPIEKLKEKVAVYPDPEILRVAQNRLREKNFAKDHGVETTPFFDVRSAAELKEHFQGWAGARAILKSNEFGYDGKGQYPIDKSTDLESLWQQSGLKHAILEGFVKFEKEVSVIIARNADGVTEVFPIAENTHKNGILDVSKVPADISEETRKSAVEIAENLAKALNVVGLLTVELFVEAEGTLLLNEIAPRPHNSGHWSLDGCVTSQFEQLVRAICGLPLGSVELTAEVEMKNLIGEDILQGEVIARESSNAILHVYGKKEIRAGRKMGHVNFLKVS